jgi:hypothetical protein
MGGRNIQPAAGWIVGNYIEMSWGWVEILTRFNSDHAILRHAIFAFLWDKLMDVASQPI